MEGGSVLLEEKQPNKSCEDFWFRKKNTTLDIKLSES